MRKSTIIIDIPTNIELIWKIVTDNTKTEWRSDLSKVEILNDSEFMEYTTKGISTKFKITAKHNLKYYEFSFGNNNMSGLWRGEFQEIDKNKTKLKFIEEIQFKNSVMELLSYLFFPLKKIQKKYMDDLQKESKKLL